MGQLNTITTFRLLTLKSSQVICRSLYLKSKTLPVHWILEVVNWQIIGKSNYFLILGFLSEINRCRKKTAKVKFKTSLRICLGMETTK